MTEELSKKVENMIISELPKATGLVALSGRKPGRKPMSGTPVNVLTNLREISIEKKHPIYKYAVIIYYIYKKAESNDEGQIEISKSTRKGLEHEMDKNFCHTVYLKACAKYPELQGKGDTFYDRQASLYTFHLIKNDNITFVVNDRDLSTRPNFLRAEFILKKVEDSFQSTSDSISTAVNLCPKLIDRTLPEALNLIISAPIFAKSHVLTAGNCVHYLYSAVPDMKEINSCGRISAAGAKKSVKVLEGPVRQQPDGTKAPIPTLYLSTELKTTFFHPDNSYLLEYMRAFPGFNTKLTANSPWSLQNEHCFVGLYVSQSYGTLEGDERLLKIKGFGPSARNKTFMKDGVPTSVQDYFSKVHKIQLKNPDLFTIEARGKSGVINIPVEVLHVCNSQVVTTEQMTRMEQSQLIPLSGKFPYERKDRTEFVTGAVGLTSETYHGFIHVGNSVTVQALELPKPDVFFGNNQKVNWNDTRKKYMTDFTASGKYYRPAKLYNWEVVFNQGEAINGAIPPLTSTMRTFGMDVRDPAISFISGGNLETVFQNAKANNRQMLFFITHEHYHYHQLIKAMEQKHGILTQDMKFSTAEKLSTSRDTRQNIIQKVNTKLGGINYIISNQAFAPGRIVMAFETSQHGGGGDGPVSVGYSANMSNHYQTFSGGYVFTKRSSDTYGPILRSTVHKILTTVAKNRPSEKITELIIYFNGVTEGQYSLIREVYVEEIKEACKLIAGTFRPHITLIASSKTHNERFYKSLGSNQKVVNLDPGTVIDSVVVSPVLDEFYLASAVARKGTSKTTNKGSTS